MYCFLLSKGSVNDIISITIGFIHYVFGYFLVIMNLLSWSFLYSNEVSPEHWEIFIGWGQLLSYWTLPVLTSSVFTEAVKNIFWQKISKIGIFNMLMSTQYQVHGRNEHLWFCALDSVYCTFLSHFSSKTFSAFIKVWKWEITGL